MVGPTAVGKTEIALHLARKLRAEIISVDSMQVYRGMDIGTGKPSAALQREIPHHGIDLVDPEQEFDVLGYVEAVAPAIRKAKRKGTPLLFVGGAGLYLRVLRRGLCSAPGRDLEIRDRLLKEGAAQGAPILHRRLERVDPAGASRIHPNDLKRVVRALEVYEQTGRSLSEWHRETDPAVPGLEDLPVLGLSLNRESLHARIDARLKGWLESGWVEEAKALHARLLSRTAREALGYRELFDHLEGKLEWKAVPGLIAQDTRRYAKRQMTWFRHEPGVEWFPIDGMKPADAAEAIWKKRF